MTRPIENRRNTFRSAATFCVAVLFAFAFACTGAESVATNTATESAVRAETININTATRDQLMRIPSIGEKLGDDIVAYREKYGPFRNPEQLLLIDGISDRRFREIRHLIRTS